MQRLCNCSPKSTVSVGIQVESLELFAWQVRKPGNQFENSAVSRPTRIVRPQQPNGDADSSPSCASASYSPFSLYKKCQRHALSKYSTPQRHDSKSVDESTAPATSGGLRSSFRKLVELEKSGLREQFSRYFAHDSAELSGILSQAEFSFEESLSSICFT